MDSKIVLLHVFALVCSRPERNSMGMSILSLFFLHSEASSDHSLLRYYLDQPERIPSGQQQ